MRNAMWIIRVRRLVLASEVGARVLTYSSAGSIRAAKPRGVAVNDASSALLPARVGSGIEVSDGLIKRNSPRNRFAGSVWGVSAGAHAGSFG
jgi:hypothetical protein